MRKRGISARVSHNCVARVLVMFVLTGGAFAQRAFGQNTFDQIECEHDSALSGRGLTGRPCAHARAVPMYSIP